MLSYFPNIFTRVKLWNRTPVRAETLLTELKELFPEIEFMTVKSSVMCVKSADCIVTATNSSQPLFELKDLKENVMINGKYVARDEGWWWSTFLKNGIVKTKIRH
jgi:ornithine cyclodeaminase/alanine dehydrogenase-like protein (mu-crystallin family)